MVGPEPFLLVGRSFCGRGGTSAIFGCCLMFGSLGGKEGREEVGGSSLAGKGGGPELTF